jgi:hypothetical protein
VLLLQVVHLRDRVFVFFFSFFLPCVSLMSLNILLLQRLDVIDISTILIYTLYQKMFLLTFIHLFFCSLLLLSLSAYHLYPWCKISVRPFYVEENKDGMNAAGAPIAISWHMRQEDPSCQNYRDV